MSMFSSLVRAIASTRGWALVRSTHWYDTFINLKPPGQLPVDPFFFPVYGDLATSDPILRYHLPWIDHFIREHCTNIFLKVFNVLIFKMRYWQLAQ